MTRQWRRCIDCGKWRARPKIDRCRQCHGNALLDALDRIEIAHVETAFHRWQHGEYGLTAETCSKCQRTRAATERLAARHQEAA